MALPDQRFTNDALRDTAKKSLIDCHVHLAALPDSDNGCYISPKMLKSPLFRFLLWKHRLRPDKPHEANKKYVNDLLGELRTSRHVQKAVLLGMDGVYDPMGRLDRAHTDFLIGNDYLLKTVQAYPDEFLAGVSINPQRQDAIEEVHRCADAGATLVKVLPNTQQFNPSDPRYKAFYRALAERKLPFLSHVGYEFSLIGKDQSVGDPDLLRLALDEGATVIAAHACSYGLILYEKFLPPYESSLDAIRTSMPISPRSRCHIDCACCCTFATIRRFMNASSSAPTIPSPCSISPPGGGWPSARYAR